GTIGQHGVSPMIRRILTVIVADGIEDPQWTLVAKSTEISDLLERLKAPETRYGNEVPEGWRAQDFQLYDWSGRALPPDIRVAEVPTPGILIAVLPSGKVGRLFSDRMLRQWLTRDKRSTDRLGRFLSSPDAIVPGAPVKQTDVFVSYY